MRLDSASHTLASNDLQYLHKSETYNISSKGSHALPSDNWRGAKIPSDIPNLPKLITAALKLDDTVLLQQRAYGMDRALSWLGLRLNI